MIGIHVRTDVRKDTGEPTARGLYLRVLASHPVHVGRRPAKVGDSAGEARRLVADFLDLVQDGFLRAALDDAPLVLGDRAEGAAAEATPHDVDREADHLEGRNFGLAVAGMRFALVRRAIDRIHFRRRQRNRRRIQPDIAFGAADTVRLHQRPCIAGVRFEVKGA